MQIKREGLTTEDCHACYEMDCYTEKTKKQCQKLFFRIILSIFFVSIKPQNTINIHTHPTEKQIFQQNMILFLLVYAMRKEITRYSTNHEYKCQLMLAFLNNFYILTNYLFIPMETGLLQSDDSDYQQYKGPHSNPP